VPSRGACSCKDALEIHAGYDIFEVGVLIGLKLPGVKGLEARREDNGTHIEIDLGWLLLEIYGTLLTKLLTGLALAFLALIDCLEIQAGASVNGVLQRHGLSKRHVHGFPFIHTDVELILYLLGTFLGTNAAADALVFINVPSRLEHFDLKVSRVSGDALYFSESNKVDVGVPADLDQLRGDNSHGTLVGGEGLIELGHNPADARGPFHKMHIEA